MTASKNTSKIVKPGQGTWLPPSVVKWVRSVFARCNSFTTTKLSDIPTVHEPWLDHALIESLNREPMPARTSIDGWTVHLETHFLGGRALFESWEVADIGLLIQFRHRGQIRRSKVALLQSKRLYPNEIKALPDQAVRYREGFFSLVKDDATFRDISRSRVFNFTSESRYLAYAKGDVQDVALMSYEAQRGIPVYYLWYNPHDVPWQADVPLTKRGKRGRPTVGCRVVPAASVREIINTEPQGYHLKFGDLANLPKPFRGMHANGWRLEHFVADELLACKAGYATTEFNDQQLYNLFFRRSGPIAAAVSVTVDAPESVEFVLPELPKRLV